MKFSRKICLKIILKVTKNQGFTIPLEDTFFKKPQGGGGGGRGERGQIDPPTSFRVNYSFNFIGFITKSREITILHHGY